MAEGTRERVFSGIQPSGLFHLGNYLGAIKGMIELQDRYECIYGIVDYHAITVPYDPSTLPERKLSAAMDFLACGLDPNKATLIVQSDVPEHTELAWLLGCITSYLKLQHLPTLKDKLDQHGFASLGLLAYPVLQTADIIIYKATKVPVGKDQEPHIELAREIVRAFNQRFGETFPEPHSVYTPAPVVPSLKEPGKKMSKSVEGSYIALSDPPEVIEQKIRRMVTDPARVRRTDPGDPEKCNVFTLHKVYTPPEEREALAHGCRTAGIGCIDCKKVLIPRVIADLAPIQERRRQLEADPDYVRDVLREGARRARPIAQATLAEVKEKMGLGKI